MNILFSTKSMAIKVSVLVVSIVFAFSVLFLAFPAKAFATTSDENDVSTEETPADDITVEEEQVQDEGFSDASTVSSTDEAESANGEEVSQTDDTSSSDVVVEDKQGQADSASDAEINSEDEETSQDQESIEGQSEGTDDESSISNDDDTSSSTEEENADDEDITSTEGTTSEDLVVNEEEQVQSDDSLNSEEDVVDGSTLGEDQGNDEEEIVSEEGIIAEEAITAEEPIEEEVATENNTSEDVLTIEEETTPEVNIDILFSTDENGYISVGEETNFGIDLEGIDIAECYWDFGDGSDSLDKNPSHTYKKDGNYTQTVTIVDSNGNSYSKTITVHVSDHNPYTTEWYVSPDAASDAGDFEDGNSSENPVSIDSVLSRIVDGDTLYFLSGTYTGTYTEDKDSNISLDNIGTGTEDNPISFVGYDETIFDGGNTIDHAFSLTSPLSYLGFYNFIFINYLDSAIYIDNQEVTNIDVVDNTFAKNGAAIDITMDSDLNIENNTVVNNNIGIDVSSDNANIEHNIVVDNSQGIKVDSIRDNVAVDYNDVYNNQEDYQGTEPGENDISVDPMFTDKEALDFSLQEDSPLLNSNIIRIVQTDKDDYSLNEQVIITGSGYRPNQELILKILRPNGTFVEDITLTTDSDGSFIYDEYSVDYAGRNYLIKIISTDGNILEVLSFTDNGTIWYVNGSYTDDSDGSEAKPYKKIQDAIDAATTLAGGTINVYPGIYSEQVRIYKDNLTVQSTHGRDVTIIDAGGDTASVNYGIQVDGATGVTISGFTIQNVTRSSVDPAEKQCFGIRTKNNAGELTAKNIIIKNIKDSDHPEDKQGYAVQTEWRIDIDNMIVENCDHGISIGRWDSEGSTVRNVIARNNGHGGADNPGGFDLWLDWKDVTVENFTAESDLADGTDISILITGRVRVATIRNFISHSETEIGIQILGGFPHEGTFFHIIDSEITHKTDSAISMSCSEPPYYTDYDVEIAGTTLTDNSIGIDIGMDLAGYNELNTWGPPSGEVTITGCDIQDNDIGIIRRGQVDRGTVTINDNNIYNNTVFGVNNELLSLVDATKNWWGDASGPKQAATSPCASGDEVSDNVEYTPWLDATYPGGSERSYNVQNITTPNTYNCIQEAITAATSGDTINVLAGNYVEEHTPANFSLYINKPLTLQGAGRDLVTIYPKTHNPGTEGGGSGWESYLWMIGVQADNVTIDGFTIDGDNLDVAGGGADARGGVYLRGYRAPSSYDNLTVTNCRIQHFMQRGIYTLGESQTDLSEGMVFNDNIIDNQGYIDEETSGEGADEGAHGMVFMSADGEAKRNTITHLKGAIYAGSFGGGVTAEGNTISNCRRGFQFNSTSVESYIHNNTISNCSGAIAIYELHAKVHITDNNLTNNQQGIRLIGDGDTYDSLPPYPYQTLWDHPVTGNTITGDGTTNSMYGIYVNAWNTLDWDYGTSGDIQNNTITNYQYGIYVEEGHTGDWDTSHPVSLNIDNNTIQNNAVTGIYNYNSNDDFTANFNNIDGNINYGVDNDGTNTIDATNNWWGDALGPGNETGSNGDTVSSNVKYDPWLGASLEAATQETTQSGPATIDAIDEVGVTVEKSGDGTPTVTVAKYSENPGSRFANDLGVYTDLHIDSDSGVEQIIFRMYYTDADVAVTGLQEETLKARWWDGSNWIECSNQTVNTAGNYIEITITPTTSPSLSDLVGTAFAAGGETVSPPVISAIFCSNTNPKPDEVVTFSADVTSKFSISSYSWDFGDGSSGSGASVDHAYKKAGKYTVTLTVTNIYGNTDVKSIDVNVVAPVAKKKPTKGYIEVLGIAEEVILPEAGPNRDFLNIAILVISSVLSLLLIIKVMLGSKEKPNF